MKKAVIVDFDGTLVNINSFEFFYKELSIYSLKKADVCLFSFLLYKIIVRKLRLISHAQLKKSTLCKIKNTDLTDFVQLFVKKLCQFTNFKVVDLCKDYQSKNYSILISTGAPELYLKPFIKESGLEPDHIICSTIPDGKKADWAENLKEQKSENTTIVLNQRDEQLAVMITDHYNDLPLLRIEKEKNILVNPDKKTLLLIQEEAIKYELL